MSVTITISEMPVELQLTYHLPPEPPKGLYGAGRAVEVEWEGPAWLHAVADHFNLWDANDKMVIEEIKNAEG